MFSENLAVFFNTDEHAIAAVYTPSGYTHPGDQSVSVTGVLDRNAYDANPGGALDVSGIRSIFTGIRTDFPNLGSGAKLRDENNQDYLIVNVDQDETGEVVLLLLEVI